jgi:hypothetical protein
MAYGTLNTLDTLAASQQTIAQYGEDRAFEAIDAAVTAHNEIMNDMMGDFIERTTDRQRRYGGPANMVMNKIDEFGRSDAQKIAAGVTVGFPLNLNDINLQWTRTYFENATGQELAAQVTGAMDAHHNAIIRDIKIAIFTPTNTDNFIDRRIDNVELDLKALVNADGAAIPLGPNGETFDGATHTHYLARAGGSVAASDVTGLLNTVREHYGTGSQFLYINQAQEAAIRAMTSNFVAYVDARLLPPDTATRAQGSRLNTQNIYNRAIGLFDAAEVWVKPWVPATYMFSWIEGVTPPLVLRERRPGLFMLRLMAEDERHPLRARAWESEYGVGVWTRTNGAVLYTGNTSYAAPTIT